MSDDVADEQGVAPVPPSRVVICAGCGIASDELRWRFQPSGGPGGQHANRSNTRVELRFDVVKSRSLTDAQRARLLERLGPQVRVTCDDERSQTRNRSIALERLTALVSDALRPDPVRKRTRASRGVNERRLELKKRRSETKQSRGWRPGAE